MKFFYEMADDLIIDCPNMWISLAEISSTSVPITDIVLYQFRSLVFYFNFHSSCAGPLIAEDCLQINDLQTEIPNKAFLDHIKISNEVNYSAVNRRIK